MTGPAAGAPTRLPEPVERFLARGHGLWIDGRWETPAAARTLPVLNPADGSTLAHVALAEAADVDRAVASSRRAFDEGTWTRVAPAERSRCLERLADLLEEHEDTLAVLDTLDNGMPLAQSRGEVRSSAAHLRYYAGWATKIHGETIPVREAGRFFVYTRREPVGVVAAITAWNFPLDNATWKLGAPLAAGDCVILKPAEETPLSALYLAQLSREAGFPPGVLNVITGLGEEAGAALSEHPRVDKIAFTGSTETGRKIVAASAGNLKRVTLELGGKSAVILLDDVAVEEVAPSVLHGVFHNAGQVCSALSRVLVQRRRYRPFTERVAELASRIRVGPGLDPDTQMGPLVSETQLHRVLGYIDAGRREGAHVLCGGTRPGGPLGNGYFVAPTVFGQVDPGMRIAQEEIFGPVLGVVPFDTLDEAVALANATPYGLAAGVWTHDLAAAHRLAANLRSGTVWVNCDNEFDPAVPFGGYRQSGYGRELGAHALEAYTHVKSVWISLAGPGEGSARPANP